MRLTLIDAPTAEIVSLADAKAHMNVTTNDDDLLIARLIATATARLEGERGRLGRCLRPAGYRLSLSAFLDEIGLPLPPTLAVSEVAYVDAQGMARIMDADDYRVVGLRSDAGTAVARKLNSAWPYVAGGPDAVQITFTAGYETPPVELVSAILMHVAHLYENREASIVGVSITTTPMGYDDLVAPYEIWAC